MYLGSTDLGLILEVVKPAFEPDDLILRQFAKEFCAPQCEFIQRSAIYAGCSSCLFKQQIEISVRCCFAQKLSPSPRYSHFMFRVNRKSLRDFFDLVAREVSSALWLQRARFRTTSHPTAKPSAVAPETVRMGHQQVLRCENYQQADFEFMPICTRPRESFKIAVWRGGF